MEKRATLGKWVTFRKVGHTLENGSLLKELVTLGMIGHSEKCSTLGKIGHSWKNGSHLEIWFPASRGSFPGVR